MAVKKQIRIPSNWRKTKNGTFKANIPYKRTFGIIDPESIPDCVIMISAKPDNIILYSQEKPIIPEGTMLIFKTR